MEYDTNIHGKMKACGRKKCKHLRKSNIILTFVGEYKFLNTAFPNI